MALMKMKSLLLPKENTAATALSAIFCPVLLSAISFMRIGGAWRGQERSWILHHPEDHQLFEDGQGWHTPGPPTCGLNFYSVSCSYHTWARYITSQRKTMLTSTSKSTRGRKSMIISPKFSILVFLITYYWL